jgi:TolB protein
MRVTNLIQKRRGARKNEAELSAWIESPSARAARREYFGAGLLLLAFLAAANAAEPQLVRLTTDGDLKQRPAWSPDGLWLAFTRHQGTSIFLFLRSADGSQEKRLTGRKDPECDAVWSPDGQRLAFCFDKTAPNQGDMDVYTIGADGEDLQPVLVTNGKLSHEEWPSWSPDGRWLTLSSTRDGNQEIYVIRHDGQELRRLTNDPAIDAHPAWSPDGQRIVFATSLQWSMPTAATSPG